ncbi:MAG TPA: hypothetical protein VFM68_02585 [Candidatus Saccharimonadales bacterium]|nr:hypothetical protein [Candidatus Saccharimonadales bacterium]
MTKSTSTTVVFSDSVTDYQKAMAEAPPKTAPSKKEIAAVFIAQELNDD